MYFNYEDINIYYEKYGSSDKTIVILPGWGNTRNTFDELINFFKDKYTIYIFDYPGFGFSNFPNRDLDIYDYSNIIREFFDEFNIVDPIIIGHSFGGRIISTLIGYYNISFEKVVLLDSAGFKRKIKFKTYLYKFLKKIGIFLPNKIKTKYLNKLFSIFASDDYKNIDKNMSNTFKNIVNYDLSKYIKNIKLDTLLIWGEKDNSTPLKDGYKFKKYISTSALIVIKEADHFPYLQYPSLINNIIYEFIK